MITVKNASFGYNGEPVIKNVSFEVQPGEFIGLIGPNGAGKSTLFKGLLRLVPTLAGSVTYSPTVAGRLGYVPQRDQLDAIYPLTAFDVARMGVGSALPWYRFPNRAMNEKVMQCLAQVGMDRFRDDLYAELSGGQRQRVLIARSLALDPVMLVLDEPTAGIDPVAEENILKLLGELNTGRGLTVLMVSHHIHSLRGRVHRVILVKDGAVQCGTADELLHADKI